MKDMIESRQPGQGTGRFNPFTGQFESLGQDIQPPQSSQKLTYAALASMLAPEVLGALGGPASTTAAATGGSTAPLPVSTGLPIATKSSLLGSLLGGAGGPAGGLLGIGAGVIGGILGQKNANANRQMQQAALDEQKREFDINAGMSRDQLEQAKANQALGATQLNPFTQAQARQKQAMLASLLSGYKPLSFDAGGHASGGMHDFFTPEKLAGVLQFMTPDAMRANEEQFVGNVSAASGGKYVAPNYGRVGYGGQAGSGSDYSYFAAPGGGDAGDSPLRRLLTTLRGGA